MKLFIENIGRKIREENYEITYAESEKLFTYDFEKDTDSLNILLNEANQIRLKFNGDKFDLCTIVNAKSGNCSEDCTYCAQSSHYTTGAPVYELMSDDEILGVAMNVESEKVDKFSLVTSGKGLEFGCELDRLEKIYVDLSEKTALDLCASHGIISEDVANKLKQAGVKTYHHNLETSREFYDKICTTHLYQERVDTCINARNAGMKVCSGGILGLGENTIDRLNMVFELKALKVDSVPINILMPIEGTPLSLNKSSGITPLEILKTIAIFKFILPWSVIRYAGGRVQLGDLQKTGLTGGVNGALTGNFLTTTGNTIKEDREMAHELGYQLKK